MNIKSLTAKKGKGFTLVEILVVILIIGLLFVFLVPKISSSTDKAREVGLKTDFHSFETAFEQLMKEKSGLGGNAGVTDATVVASVNEFLDPALQIEAGTATNKTHTSGTDEGLRSTKKDPWNNKYHFVYLSGGANTNNGYIAIVSNGKDSKPAYTPIADAAALNAITDADGFQTAVNGTVAGSTTDGHDYVLACAYLQGVEYTATAGFSTNIQAN